MAVLNKIIEMKKQGLQTGQIIQMLKEQGANPKEINEALSQSEIKSEINQEYDDQQNKYPSDEYSDMQPSIMTEPPAPYEEQNQYQEPPTEYAPQETYQNYQSYQEYQPQQSIDVETISDLSSQIVEEKTKSFKKEIASLTKFKEQFENEIKNIDKRLSKIESTIEELQMAILRKIGNYGEDIKNISKEVRATQDSFSKILNPLVDNIREMEKITGRAENKSAQATQDSIIDSEGDKNISNNTKDNKKKNKNTGFEDYLR